MKVTDITNGGMFSKFQVRGNNGKVAIITDYKTYWSIKYPNGNIKNVKEYHEAVAWLEARGY